MEAGADVPESIGLDEIVELRLRALIVSVRNGSAQNIELELTAIAELIDAYGRKEELLENLLDPLTKAADRRQILETIKSQQSISVRNQDELKRLHNKSRHLLKQSIQLLLVARKQVYRRHHGDEFSPELCSYCQGFGRAGPAQCPACKGQRFVLVHQPGIVCPRCKGQGKADSHDRIAFARDSCIVCRGSGWALSTELGSPTETAR